MSAVYKGAMPWVKLFGARLTSSSLWEEPPETRVLFLWFLVSADEDGYVLRHTLGNLARLANLPLDAVERGLARLESPDPQSRTCDDDGRRLLRLADGGWRVVNAQSYRQMQTAKQVYDAARQAKLRGKPKKRSAARSESSAFDRTHEVGGRNGWDKPGN
jgi:hypothetical protein